MIMVIILLKEDGKMIKLKDIELNILIMEINMKENLKLIILKDME